MYQTSFGNKILILLNYETIEGIVLLNSTRVCNLTQMDMKRTEFKKNKILENSVN